MPEPLLLHHDYTRREIHDIFDPDSRFTAQAGSWGLWGIVPIPDHRRTMFFLSLTDRGKGNMRSTKGSRRKVSCGGNLSRTNVSAMIQLDY